MHLQNIIILLADDDENDRLLFKEAFSELNIKTTVYTVNNGIHLMERLNKNNILFPDLLFIDLNMPCKNGLECLKEIKSNKKLKDIYVAKYSTSENENDIEKSFLTGANIYISKPNNFNTLKQVLKKAIMTAYQYQGKLMKRESFLLRIK